MSIRHFREARKAAYTTKNILSAFECTGIVPFNPRRVLGKYKGTAAADPLSPTPPINAIVPPTPANNRAVRQLQQKVQQRLKIVDDLVLQGLVDKLPNAAIGGLTKGFLGQDRAEQLEAALAIKADEAKDARNRTRLTEAKAITGEALLRLHVQRQAQPVTPQKRRMALSKHVSFNRPPKPCPPTTTTQISTIPLSSSSSSYVSFSDSDSESERLDSGSECSTIFFRTPGTIPGPSTSRPLPITPTPAPRHLRGPPKPSQEQRVLRPRRT